MLRLSSVPVQVTTLPSAAALARDACAQLAALALAEALFTASAPCMHSLQ